MAGGLGPDAEGVKDCRIYSVLEPKKITKHFGFLLHPFRLLRIFPSSLTVVKVFD
jgi:hypothetical protein